MAFAACSAGTAASDSTQCYTEKVDANQCASYTLALLGDPTTCGFDDATSAASAETCTALCGRPSCFRNGSSVVCSSGCIVDGRRYGALDDTAAPPANDVGSYLARMAFFEAASVDAFALLRDALREHGAPRSLLRSCENARRDEVRHARMAARLARRHGGIVTEPPAPRRRSRATLEDLAIENAVEGCTRETFGVLIGMWQGERASTPTLRSFFAALAKDESRHAALAHRVDAWLRSQLTRAAQRRVDAACEEARRGLAASLRATQGSFARELGLPTATQAEALLAGWINVTELPVRLAA